jgi:hypothetical protein
MPQKSLPPLPDLGDSEHDRFKRFAKAILAVPKSEAMPVEHVLSKLEAQKQEIDAKIGEVRRELAKRKT